MTETGVFKILLKNANILDYNLDFPKQQTETIKIVAKNLTDIIYESYKRKSSASTSKRYQVLKFINNVCEVPQPHEYEEYMACVIKHLQQTFPDNENEEVMLLTEEIRTDLKKYTKNRFQENLSSYFIRKNAREKGKQKQIDLITEKNQQKLNTKYHIEDKKKYKLEPNENLLNRIMGTNNTDSKITKTENTNTDNRDTQIKLAYAMVNMEQTNLLKKILNRLSNYKVLNKAEKNFLQYVWSTQNDITSIKDHIHLIYFLSEKVLLIHATNLLSLDDDDEVCQYFVNLENDCDIIKVRNLCRLNYNYYLKLKTLLYELYCISYCNDNVIKLSEIII